MWALSLILLLIFSSLLTYLVRKIALKKSIVDIPNERSSHIIPTPRGGGLAIVVTWYIGISYFAIFGIIENNLFRALLSGILLVIVGLLDDLFDLKPVYRIIAQILTVIIALFFLGGLKFIELGFFRIDYPFILTIIAFIGIIWFINLFNFLDGIDGYASMQAIFLSSVFFYFTSSNHYMILAASVAGFLIWNWQPAKIFMGDVGSTLLGFNFGIFAVYEQNAENVPIISFLAISSLFWFDATLTLLRRIRNKEKIGQAHRKHAYQRIVRSGISHQTTTLTGLVINLIILISVLLCHNNILLVVIPFIFSIFLLYCITRWIDKRTEFKNN